MCFNGQGLSYSYAFGFVFVSIISNLGEEADEWGMPLQCVTAVMVGETTPQAYYCPSLDEILQFPKQTLYKKVFILEHRLFSQL